VRRDESILLRQATMTRLYSTTTAHDPEHTVQRVSIIVSLLTEIRLIQLNE